MMNFGQFKYSCRVKTYRTKRLKIKSNAKQNNDKVLRPFLILTHNGSYYYYYYYYYEQEVILKNI